MINWNQIEGNWKQFKGQAQQRWGELTSDELDQIKGRQTELVGKIQAKYGKTREEAEREVAEWQRTMN